MYSREPQGRGPLAENGAFLVDDYVAGNTAVAVARHNFPRQFLHYHRAGQSAIASPQTQREYTVSVLAKISRYRLPSGFSSVPLEETVAVLRGKRKTSHLCWHGWRVAGGAATAGTPGDGIISRWAPLWQQAPP